MSISLKSRLLFPYIIIASSITGVVQPKTEVLPKSFVSHLDNFVFKNEKDSTYSKDIEYNFSLVQSNPLFSTIDNKSSGEEQEAKNSKDYSKIVTLSKQFSLSNLVYSSNNQFTQFSHLMNLDSKISSNLKTFTQNHQSKNENSQNSSNEKNLYFYSILFLLFNIGLAYSFSFLVHYKSQKGVQQRLSFLKVIQRFSNQANSGTVSYWYQQHILSHFQTMKENICALIEKLSSAYIRQMQSNQMVIQTFHYSSH